ncbi:protein argonaute 4B-like [Panicum virgatum]|nr:protein argonaute 4B-like [Panicum virgatum]
MESTTSKGDPGELQVSERLPISRPDDGYGTKGKKIRLLANHFKVSVHSPDVIFHHYNVKLMYEDNKQVVEMGVGRKMIDKLQEIYASELTNVSFAYDGDENLFTIGALQHVKNVYTVVVEDVSSAK